MGCGSIACLFKGTFGALGFGGIDFIREIHAKSPHGSMKPGANVLDDDVHLRKPSSHFAVVSF